MMRLRYHRSVSNGGTSIKPFNEFTPCLQLPHLTIMYIQTADVFKYVLIYREY